MSGHRRRQKKQPVADFARTAFTLLLKIAVDFQTSRSSGNDVSSLQTALRQVGNSLQYGALAIGSCPDR
jgi:hypothetical protein